MALRDRGLRLEFPAGPTYVCPGTFRSRFDRIYCNVNIASLQGIFIKIQILKTVREV